MHSDLINDPEGVSLEKIRPYLGSDIPSSWFSASASAGWATPGVENSVLIDDLEEESIGISSKVITPDGDGTDDFVLLDLNFRDPGTLISITVFNDQGMMIREVAKNHFCGTSCTFIWDATDNSHSTVERGIYIILLNGYDRNGRHHRKKFPVAVAR